MVKIFLILSAQSKIIYRLTTYKYILYMYYKAGEMKKRKAVESKKKGDKRSDSIINYSIDYIPFAFSAGTSSCHV